MIWFSWRENFVSYMISTQCWSLANQNYSFLSRQTLQLSLSLKRYILPYYLVRSFLYKKCFLWAYFFKRAFDWIHGVRYMEKHILSSEPPEVAFCRCSRTFSMVANFTRYILLEFEKIFRTSIFLSTSEGLLLNILGTRSWLLWSFIYSISHFSSLETECTEAAICSCFSK